MWSSSMSSMPLSSDLAFFSDERRLLMLPRDLIDARLVGDITPLSSASSLNGVIEPEHLLQSTCCAGVVDMRRPLTPDIHVSPLKAHAQ